MEAESSQTTPRASSRQRLLGELLKAELERRQRTNSAYSKRAFARDMGLNPGTLHGVLSGTRAVPQKNLREILQKLRYSKAQVDRLLASGPADQKLLSELTSFDVIAEWEHYAVLTLMDSQYFRSDPAWIAASLDLSPARTTKVLDNLLHAGLIALAPGGAYEKCQGSVRTSEDRVSAALKQAHLEELELARERLGSVPVAERDYSSVMICMPRTNVAKAKQLIRDFRRQFEALCEDSSGSDAYQLCIQLFPLTVARNVSHKAPKGGTRA